jgi:hypothetical protein
MKRNKEAKWMKEVERAGRMKEERGREEERMREVERGREDEPGYRAVMSCHWPESRLGNH